MYKASCSGCGEFYDASLGHSCAVVREQQKPTPSAGLTGSIAESSSVVVIDIDSEMWAQIKEAAAESNWIPKEYFMNDWVSDVCRFLRDRE